MGLLPALGHTVCMTLINSSVCYDAFFTNMLGLVLLSIGAFWAGSVLIRFR